MSQSQRQRKCLRLKETKDIKLGATYDLRLDPSWKRKNALKDILGQLTN